VPALVRRDPLKPRPFPGPVGAPGQPARLKGTIIGAEREPTPGAPELTSGQVASQHRGDGHSAGSTRPAASVGSWERSDRAYTAEVREACRENPTPWTITS
jgi:hypothetical protein